MNEGNTGYHPTTEGARQLHNGIMAALKMNHGFDPNAVMTNEKGEWGPVYRQTEEPVGLVAKALRNEAQLDGGIYTGAIFIPNEVPVKMTTDGYTIIDKNTSVKFAK